MAAASSSAPPDEDIDDGDDDNVDDEAAAAAEALMLSVQRGFGAAKAVGVPAATRLMKELQTVCSGSSGVEIKLINDNLQQWLIAMYDWAFDEASPLHKDLKALSEAADDLVPLQLRISFPDDFPFAAPLVFCAAPALASEYIFDGALCMEMCARAHAPKHPRGSAPQPAATASGCDCRRLRAATSPAHRTHRRRTSLYVAGRLVDWQPTYGNVEALLVQICAFLAHSNARVASLAKSGGDGGGAGAVGGAAGGAADGVVGGAEGAAAAAAAAAAAMAPSASEDDEAQRMKAERAYENLKAFHAKKGWSNANAMA